MEKYPVDPDNIEKGMVIAKDEIERITGEKAGTDAYRLKALGLKEKIEDMMRDAGRPMRLCSDHDSLVVLKDNEASEYNERRFESLKRGVLRAIRSQLEVDTSNLTDEQSSRHTRRLHCMAIEGQSMIATREGKRLTLPYHKRMFPVAVVEDG